MARKKPPSMLSQQRAKLKAQQETKARQTPTKVGRTKRLNGRIVKWNGKRWVPTTQPAAKTAPKATVKTPPAKTPKVSKVSPSQAAAAGRRALRGTATRTGVKGGLVGVAMAAVDAAGRSGALGPRVRDSMAEDEARVGRMLNNPLQRDTTGTKKTPKTPKKPSRTGSVSTPTNYPTTAVTRTRRPGRDIQAESGRTRTPSRPPSTPARTPAAPKTPAKKSAVHTYKKHGSDLHIGRHKTLKEHRAAVAERKKKNQG